MGMRLLCLGSGDAFSALHYSSSFALECGGRWVLVDCPHPIRKIMREASLAAGIELDLPQIDAVVLTHLHGDHVSGLEIFAYYSRFVLKRRLTLYTHPDVVRLLWPAVLSGSMGWVTEEPQAAPREQRFEDFFDYRPLDERRAATIGSFEVCCRKTWHSIPTIALKFCAGGRRLGYSADTRFDPSLLDWLADADLIVHEANSGAVHTSLEELLTADQALLRKMRLIHVADSFQEAAAPMPVLREGMLLDV